MSKNQSSQLQLLKSNSISSLIKFTNRKLHHSKLTSMFLEYPNSQTNFSPSPMQDNLQNAHTDPNHPTNKECRICLSRAQEANNPFISPCLCSGSIKHVHQDCLREWIQRVIQKNVSLSSGVTAQCQLCKSNFAFQILVKKQCLSCNQLSENIKTNKAEFGILLFCQLASLMLLIYSIVQLAMMVSEDFSTIEIAAKVVIICSILLSLATAIWLLPKLSKFFFKYRAEIQFQNVGR